MNGLLPDDAELTRMKPAPLFYLAYTSQLVATSAFGKTVFTDICQSAIKNNHGAAITGFLFFKKGRFFQYLEGSEAQVRALYQKICQDQRHKNLRVLIEGYQEERLFPAWAMHCFKSGYEDEGEVISPHLQDFAVNQWDGDTAHTVIGTVKAYYQSNPIAMQHQYQPLSVSYVYQRAHSVVQQHSTFIMLQLTFIVMALLMAGYWLCFAR